MISTYLDFLYSFLSKNLKDFNLSVKRINGVITLYKDNKSYELTFTSNQHTNVYISLNGNGITTHQV